MAVAVNGIDQGSGGVVLKAAGLVAADTAETAVFLGRGWHLLNIVTSACETDTGDEIYNVQLQANTVADAATFFDLTNVIFGGSTALGGAAATGATGDMWLAFFNPYDNGVRVKTWVGGTIVTGINQVITAYSVPVVGAF